MSEQLYRTIRQDDDNYGVTIPKGPERIIPEVQKHTEKTLHIPYGTSLVTNEFDRHGRRIILPYDEYVPHMLALGVKLRLDDKRGEE